MFNSRRRGCGCNHHHHHHEDHCKPQRPSCKPTCHPVCFNVIVKRQERCKEFDGCNSYPEPHHDECKEDIEMICCCCQ